MLRRAALVSTGFAVGFATIAFSPSFQKNDDDSWEGHIPKNASLRRVQPGVLVATSDMYGLATLRRMICLRLPSGGLLVFSPMCLPESLMREVESEGPIEFIVAPCAMHRLDTSLYKTRYPNAAVLAPAKARTSVEQRCKVDSTLEDTFSAGNSFNITFYEPPMRNGNDELVLQIPLVGGDDKKNNCLVWADFCQNIDSKYFSFPLSTLFKVYGVASEGANTLQMSHGFRLLGKSKSELKQFVSSLAAVSEENNVTTLLMCHGEPIVGTPQEISQQFRTLASKI